MTTIHTNDTLKIERYLDPQHPVDLTECYGWRVVCGPPTAVWTTRPAGVPVALCDTCLDRWLDIAIERPHLAYVDLGAFDPRDAPRLRQLFEHKIDTVAAQQAPHIRIHGMTASDVQARRPR